MHILARVHSRASLPADGQRRRVQIAMGLLKPFQVGRCVCVCGGVDGAEWIHVVVLQEARGVCSVTMKLSSSHSPVLTQKPKPAYPTVCDTATQ